MVGTYCARCAKKFDDRSMGEARRNCGNNRKVLVEGRLQIRTYEVTNG